MSRLIDADVLIKYIPPEEHGALVAVKCCPTAYDVDKVIDELKAHLIEAFDYYAEIEVIEGDEVYKNTKQFFKDCKAIREALNIVQKGGV